MIGQSIANALRAHAQTAEQRAHSDVIALRLREMSEQHNGTLYEYHARTQQRIRENAIIAEAQRTGTAVAVVWSGRDCDCVSYSGDVSLVKLDETGLAPDSCDANGDPFTSLRAAVDRHIEQTYYWADGPCSYYITTEAAAKQISYASRDLALEAFEDGHAHVIYG
jgi:hypothetical protein